MRIQKTIFILFATLLSLAGFAQSSAVVISDSLAIIEGETYYIHSVQARQTLFTIASTYEVKLSRIAFDNPGVLDGLKLGQLLKILKSAQGETKPVEASDEKLEIDGEYVLYKVPRRQTLYSISKEYNTSVSSILDANPELANGLKVGSTIRIPVPKILGEETSVKEKMVGLPDIVRKEAVQEKIEVASIAKGHITLMLPLYLDMNDTLGSTKLAEQDEEIYGKSEIALQFYEGFLMALDTLAKMGHKVKVTVIDTENRPWKVRKLVENGALRSTDLIIGPLYTQVFKEVSTFAYNNCIPLVSPTIKSAAIVSNNDFVFKQIPSEESMIFELGSYLSGSDSTTNAVIHYGAGDEQNMLWKFRQGLEVGGGKAVAFPAFNIYKAGSDSLRSMLSLTKRNNLVVLSNNQVKLAGLLRKLTTWTEDAYIVAYAPNEWQGFKNLEMDHFDDLRVHMPTDFYIDYEELRVQEFVQKFRLKYASEPSTFAFRGYDLAMHFVANLNGLKEFGPDYMLSVEETGMQSKFGWTKRENGGYENSRSRIVDYTGLELKLATD
jgi:LysM repeat protein/ABC-type branched-subunit amino acid transport system substrate-binding protein